MFDPEGVQKDRAIEMHEAISKMEELIPTSIEYYRCKVMDFNSTPGASMEGNKITSYIEKGLAINPC